jgi:NTP pyrophosphatase (non-canonical NTP hydrolase)
MRTPKELIELEHQIDQAVLQFTIDMKYKLRLNNHKGHWKDQDFTHLLMKLNGEVSELVEALKPIQKSGRFDQKVFMDIIHECADVSNYAMMIADNAKRMMVTTDAKRQ